METSEKSRSARLSTSSQTIIAICKKSKGLGWRVSQIRVAEGILPGYAMFGKSTPRRQIEDVPVGTIFSNARRGWIAYAGLVKWLRSNRLLEESETTVLKPYVRKGFGHEGDDDDETWAQLVYRCSGPEEASQVRERLVTIPRDVGGRYLEGRVLGRRRPRGQGWS